jgi:uncharacterized membrane protein YdjX (TVP38/TMEM64 family)
VSVTNPLPRRLAALTALAVLAGLVVASDALHDRIAEVVLWSEGVIARAPVAGMAAFVVLSMLSAMLAFLSSGLLSPVAIAAWGKAGTLALLWLGWLLGGTLTYAVGRYLGRSAAGAIVGAETLATWEHRVSSRTHVLHVLLFQIAMPSEILGYVLGILRYRFRTYIAVLAITEIPYAVAVVYLGESFLAGNALMFGLIAAASIGVSAGLYYVLRRVAVP